MAKCRQPCSNCMLGCNECVRKQEHNCGQAHFRRSCMRAGGAIRMSLRCHERLRDRSLQIGCLTGVVRPCADSRRCVHLGSPPRLVGLAPAPPVRLLLAAVDAGSDGLRRRSLRLQPRRRLQRGLAAKCAEARGRAQVPRGREAWRRRNRAGPTRAQRRYLCEGHDTTGGPQAATGEVVSPPLGPRRSCSIPSRGQVFATKVCSMRRVPPCCVQTKQALQVHRKLLQAHSLRDVVVVS